MMSKAKLLAAALLTTAVISQASYAEKAKENNVIKRTVTVSGVDGDTMELTQVLSPNLDGSYTIISLEPEDEVKEFYDRQCEKMSSGYKYAGIKKSKVSLSEAAIAGFICEKP
jgi:hypothetical protein